MRVLREHPEWLEEVRRLILTEELLRLPARFDAFVQESREFQNSITARVDTLEQRFDDFVQEMREFKQEMYEFRDRITEEVRVLRQDVNRLDGQMQMVINDLARLKGSDRENFYRSRAASIFGRLLRSVRLTDTNRLFDQIAERFPGDRNKMNEIGLADLIVEGTGRESGVPKMVVLEASWTVDQSDVERAVRCAEILRQLGYNAVPAVGGEEIREDALQMTLEQGVLAIVNGTFYNEAVAS